MRSARLRLEDMAEAIQGIDATLEGVSIQEFSKSWTMQRAVERGLEIISEASRSLPDDWKAGFPEVAWMQIAGIGNILPHEYHRVEPAIIWNITVTHLPTLGAAVRVLLGADKP